MAAIDTRLSANAAVLLAQVVACVDPGCLTYKSYRYASEPPVLPGENSVVVYVAGPRLDAALSKQKYNAYEVEYRFVMTRSFIGMLTPALKDGEVRWADVGVRDTIAASWMDDVAALFNCLITKSPGVLGACQGPQIIDADVPIADGEGFRTVMSVRSVYRPGLC